MKPAVAPPMTPAEQAAHVALVKEANARADAKMKPALDLYAGRNKLFHLVCRLELRDLLRLNGILARLSDADLKRVAAYAEGLAEWSDSGSESPDASNPQG